MSYITGTATDVPDLLNKLDAFLRLGHSNDPQYSTVGNGVIDGIIGTATSVLETITVTFADATNFSVAGSVSGALGSGTCGVAFSSSVVSFTITAGATPFVATDSISFLMTPPWTTLRLNTVAGSGIVSFWQAPGNDGVSKIIAGLYRTNSVTGDYETIRFYGATDFDPANQSGMSQPGGCYYGPFISILRVGSMPFWFAANGRRVTGVVKCSTVYESFYMGLITPYISPTAFPYPLALGGSMAWCSDPAQDSANWRWSYQGNEHRSFAKSDNAAQTTNGIYGCQLRMRRVDGVWQGYAIGNSGGGWGTGIGTLYPTQQYGTDLRDSLDGSYPLFPIILADTTAGSSNKYGELDGVAFVSGHANTVENTIVQNRISWLVVQNVYRNAKNEYFAIKLA